MSTDPFDLDSFAAATPPAARLHDNRLEYHDLLRLFEQAPGFVCFFRGPEHV